MKVKRLFGADCNPIQLSPLTLAATAFEALFGYVYLSGDLERLRMLFQIACEALEGADETHPLV